MVLWALGASADSLPRTPGFYDVTATMSVSGKPEHRDRCVTMEHLGSPEAVLNYAFAKKFAPLPDH